MKRHVIAAIDDIIFISKVRAVAEGLGVEISFPKGNETLLKLVYENAPSMIVFDLHSQRFDPFSLVEKLKADDNLRTIPAIGFFSHVQVDLKDRAIKAGFDKVIPRSVFTKNLVEILSETKDS
jgi:CheY-like chemotaxis protein